MTRRTLILTTVLGFVVLSGCLSVVEPIQREYHVDTVIQPGEIYTKEVKLDDPSERVIPTICYNITANDTYAHIFVFNDSAELRKYRRTLRNTENLSDLTDEPYPNQTGRLSDAWHTIHRSGTKNNQAFRDYILGGLEPGTYYFTVENTAFRRYRSEQPVDRPLAVKLDLYVVNKDCPYS